MRVLQNHVCVKSIFKSLRNTGAKCHETDKSAYAWGLG